MTTRFTKPLFLLAPVLLLVLALAVSLGVAAPASAAVLSACTEQALRDAITAINNATTTDTVITFPAGSCAIIIAPAGVGEDANASGDFDILASMTINGVNANLSIISGGNAHRCFDVNPNASPNVTFTLNNVTVQNCDASGEAPGNTNGGGLIATSATVNLNNVRFTGNRAAFGGGLRDDDSFMNITNSTFDANTATADGGGLWLDLSQDTLTNVTVSGNTAQVDGGGILHNAGPLTINNATIAGNTASSDGGGIFVDAGATTLRNSIIAQNTATALGDDCVIGTGSITSSNNVYGTITDCSVTPAPSDQPNAGTSVVQSLAANGGQTPTRALATGSVAISNGNTPTCAATDQRGVTRPVGANCDSGAYELVTVQGLTTALAVVKSGSNVTVNTTVANAGPAVPADVYFGAVLSPSLSVSLGCPAGNGIAFFGPGNAVAISCASAHPSTFTKNQTVTIPGALPAVTVPILSFTRPPGLTTTLTFFIALVQPNGFLDGVNLASAPTGDIESAATVATTLP